MYIISTNRGVKTVQGAPDNGEITNFTHLSESQKEFVRIRLQCDYDPLVMPGSENVIDLLTGKLVSKESASVIEITNEQFVIESLRTAFHTVSLSGLPYGDAGAIGLKPVSGSGFIQPTDLRYLNVSDQVDAMLTAIVYRLQETYKEQFQGDDLLQLVESTFNNVLTNITSSSLGNAFIDELVRQLLTNESYIRDTLQVATTTASKIAIVPLYAVNATDSQNVKSYMSQNGLFVKTANVEGPHVGINDYRYYTTVGNGFHTITLPIMSDAKARFVNTSVQGEFRQTSGDPLWRDFYGIAIVANSSYGKGMSSEPEGATPFVSFLDGSLRKKTDGNLPPVSNDHNKDDQRKEGQSAPGIGHDAGNNDDASHVQHGQDKEPYALSHNQMVAIGGLSALLLVLGIWSKKDEE